MKGLGVRVKSDLTWGGSIEKVGDVELGLGYGKVFEIGTKV